MKHHQGSFRISPTYISRRGTISESHYNILKKQKDEEDGELLEQLNNPPRQYVPQSLYNAPSQALYSSQTAAQALNSGDRKYALPSGYSNQPLIVADKSQTVRASQRAVLEPTVPAADVRGIVQAAPAEARSERTVPTMSSVAPVTNTPQTAVPVVEELEILEAPVPKKKKKPVKERQIVDG